MVLVLLSQVNDRNDWAAQAFLNKKKGGGCNNNAILYKSFYGSTVLFTLFCAFSGCILCFISRKESLDELVPYLDKLEKEKVLEKIELYETEEYRSHYTGLVAIYRVSSII